MADEPTTFGAEVKSIPEPIERVKAFEDLGFGLFLHYGLYSSLGTGEWVQHYHKVSPEKIKELYEGFSAEAFDADPICAMAVDAGMNYVCLTSRHHEGFSLYDASSVGGFDAPSAPRCQRDLVSEFSVACEKHGLKKYLYHTTLDWYHPGFNHDWGGYQQYLRDSVELLCKNYGRIDGLWFDGNWARPDADWQEDQLYGVIRSHQPDCIIVNNSSIGARGAVGHPELDVVTFEQGVPEPLDRRGAEKYLAAEMCETLNSHWGVALQDFSHKSPKDVIDRLVACRRYRANLLFNLGPNGDGSIGSYEKALLEVVGRWTKQHGEAITSAHPCDLECSGGHFLLQSDSTFYLFVKAVSIHGNGHLSGEKGDGPLAILGDLPSVKRVRWCDNDEDLAFEQGSQLLSIHATPFPYGSQGVVRVAKIDTDA